MDSEFEGIFIDRDRMDEMLKLAKTKTGGVFSGSLQEKHIENAHKQYDTYVREIIDECY